MEGSTLWHLSAGEENGWLELHSMPERGGGVGGDCCSSCSCTVGAVVAHDTYILQYIVWLVCEGAPLLMRFSLEVFGGYTSLVSTAAAAVTELVTQLAAAFVAGIVCGPLLPFCADLDPGLCGPRGGPRFLLKASKIPPLWRPSRPGLSCF